MIHGSPNEASTPHAEIAMARVRQRGRSSTSRTSFEANCYGPVAKARNFHWHDARKSGHMHSGAAGSPMIPTGDRYELGSDRRSLEGIQGHRPQQVGQAHGR